MKIRASRLLALVVALGVLAVPLALDARPQPSPKNWLETLETWLKAVAAHDAGETDGALQTVAAWSTSDVDVVMTNFRGFVTRVKASAAAAKESPGVDTAFSFNGRKFTLAEALLVIGLSEDDVRRGEINRLFKRAALLHTDIALLTRPALLPASSVTPVRPDPRLIVNGVTTIIRLQQPTEMVVDDGRETSVENVEHWRFARLLLDAIAPTPSSDPMVLLWYRATSADMERRRRWGQAAANLDRGITLFPADATLLFYAGALHEFLATPRTQNTVAAVSRPGVHLGVHSEDEELLLASEFLRRAIAASPDMAEAHMRLGRVTGLFGNHDEAIAELTRAISAMTDPQLVYDALLFRGYEEEAANRGDDAKADFERAALLYPTAQSPLLSLSELARRSGDSIGAQAAIGRMFQLSVQRIDPWLLYSVVHVRDGDTLVTETRRAFGSLPR